MNFYKSLWESKAPTIAQKYLNTWGEKWGGKVCPIWYGNLLWLLRNSMSKTLGYWTGRGRPIRTEQRAQKQTQTYLEACVSAKAGEKINSSTNVDEWECRGGFLVRPERTIKDLQLLVLFHLKTVTHWKNKIKQTNKKTPVTPETAWSNG